MKPEILSNLESAAGGLSVPAFDFAAIEARARRLTNRSVAKRRTVITGSAMIIILSALAAAASYFTHLNVSHGFGTWQVYGPRVAINLHPTQRTLDQLARNAPYRVIWPSALPKGTRLSMTGSMASEIMILGYGCVHGRILRFAIIPRNSDAINPNLRMWLSGLKIEKGVNQDWQVGEERVRVQTNCLTTSQIQTIRSAMQRNAKSITLRGAQRT
jgi:hypothetical protein